MSFRAVSSPPMGIRDNIDNSTTGAGSIAAEFYKAYVVRPVQSHGVRSARANKGQ